MSFLTPGPAGPYPGAAFKTVELKREGGRSRLPKPWKLYCTVDLARGSTLYVLLHMQRFKNCPCDVSRVNPGFELYASQRSYLVKLMR